MRLKTIISSIFHRPSNIELAAYQHKMPSNIDVQLSRDQNTNELIATVVRIDGKLVEGLITTSAKNDNELIDMINDAVMEYVDIPESIAFFLPKLLPEGDMYINKKTNLVLAK